MKFPEYLCVFLTSSNVNCDTLLDFTFPLYWDKMSSTKCLEEVLLDPSSAEYRTVQQAFNKTAHNTIVKVGELFSF